MTANGWCQRLSVSGTVVSKATGQAIAGVSVMSLPSGNVTVVTNDDGFFTLKDNAGIETVAVSHVGYKSKKVKVGSEEKLTIRLEPATIELHEVLVIADNARELVEKAVKRIPHNYSPQAELHHCFYRETAMKRQHYICVAEGVVDMYKTPYDGLQIDEDELTRLDRVAIIKGRRLLSAKPSDTLSVKVMGGPVTPVILDMVKNTGFLLNTEDLVCYDLKMETPTTIDDRLQYVVNIKPQRNMSYPLYSGRLYIDQQTLAFTRAELSLDMSDREKATRMMLVKKPAGVRFRPKELSLLIDYRLGDDGVTRISYIRTTFRFNCDWRKKLFATSFAAFCEMAVTGREEGKAQPIKGRNSFDQRDAFFDKVDYFRDPTFWNDYNIIEPTETLDRAIYKLLKR